MDSVVMTSNQFEAENSATNTISGGSMCESLRESKDLTPQSASLLPVCYPTFPFFPMPLLPETCAYVPPTEGTIEGYAVQPQVHADLSFVPFSSPYAAPVCQVCQVKGVAPGTFFCSKRCSWFFEGRCAQCGRLRENHYIYCSGTCANQATQANWCPTCAVRQILCGTTSCGFPTCVSQQSSASHRLPRKKVMRSSSSFCELMGPHDKLRETVFSQFSPALQSGAATTVLAIIKIQPDSARKKQYLNHRAAIETNIAQRNVMKYGYGGEGNEQRRFFAMNMKCKLGFNGVVEPCTNGNEETSSGRQCDLCSVLQHGFQLRRMNCASHYCTTSAVNAAAFATPNPDGVKAAILARVVVGAPLLIPVDPSNYEPPTITIPEDPVNVHSTIVTNGNPNDDGTYVFRDDAVDAQFVVLFQ